MGDLDKTSIVILVCVLTAAVITICLIVIIVYRKKWCRKSEDKPEISGSISMSDIHEYDDEDELKGLTGDIDDEHMRVHSSSDANGARGAYRGSPYFHSGVAINEEEPRILNPTTDFFDASYEDSEEIRWPLEESLGSTICTNDGIMSGGSKRHGMGILAQPSMENWTETLARTVFRLSSKDEHQPSVNLSELRPGEPTPWVPPPPPDPPNPN